VRTSPPFGAVAAVVATVNSDVRNGQIWAAVSSDQRAEPSSSAEIECFIGVDIYTRSGLLAQGLSSLPTLFSVPG